MIALDALSQHDVKGTSLHIDAEADASKLSVFIGPFNDAPLAIGASSRVVTSLVDLAESVELRDTHWVWMAIAAEDRDGRPR